MPLMKAIKHVWLLILLKETRGTPLNGLLIGGSSGL